MIPTWQGGRVRSITGTDPAAGVEIVETVPVGKIWVLLGFRFVFVTAAVAVTRLVEFNLDGGGTTVVDMVANETQITTLTRAYVYGPGMGFPSTNGGASTATTIAIPAAQQFPMAAGFRIRTVTNNLQPTDNYAAPTYIIQEFDA